MLQQAGTRRRSGKTSPPIVWASCGLWQERRRRQRDRPVIPAKGLSFPAKAGIQTLRSRRPWSHLTTFATREFGSGEPWWHAAASSSCGPSERGGLAVDVALSAYDYLGRTVHRDSSRQLVSADATESTEIRAWRKRFGRGSTLYRVEAIEPDSLRAARALGELVSLPGIGFRVSDLVLAERVRPKSDSAVRWSDYEIEPSVGNFAHGDTVSLLWETYWLTSDSGANRYRISITLEPREELRGIRGLAAKIVGGFKDVVGVSAQGARRMDLSYTREVPERLVQVDYVSLYLGLVPSGAYRLAVAITDIPSRRTAITERDIQIGG